MERATYVYSLCLKRIAFARNSLPDFARLQLSGLVLPDDDSVVERSRVGDDSCDVRPDVVEVRDEHPVVAIAVNRV